MHECDKGLTGDIIVECNLSELEKLINKANQLYIDLQNTIEEISRFKVDIKSANLVEDDQGNIIYRFNRISGFRG